MIPTAPFGRTGHESSRVLFGAAALSRVTQETADQLLPLLLEHGVNHIDTASSYGESELRLAPWLVEHRDRFFLATKTGERDGPGARASLERSLDRLGVDKLDLVQLHNLVEEEDFERAFAPRGAVEALARAREEGLVRFIGVTGHGLRIASMHLRSLERFPFDSVLFPYNFALMQSSAYRSDVEALVAACRDRGVATQTIKSIARRRWTEPASPDRPHRSWYEPLEDDGAIARAVGYVLSTDQLFLNSSSDFNLLESILIAARNATMPAVVDLERDVANFEMSALFDGDALERI